MLPDGAAGGCRDRRHGAERVARGDVAMVAGVPSRWGSASLLVGAAFEAVAEAPALGAGVDDVRAVGDPVDDGLREARVGEDLGPFAERQVRGHDQAAAL